MTNLKLVAHCVRNHIQMTVPHSPVVVSWHRYVTFPKHKILSILRKIQSQKLLPPLDWDVDRSTIMLSVFEMGLQEVRTDLGA